MRIHHFFNNLTDISAMIQQDIEKLNVIEVVVLCWLFYYHD